MIPKFMWKLSAYDIIFLSLMLNKTVNNNKLKLNDDKSKITREIRGNDKRNTLIITAAASILFEIWVYTWNKVDYKHINHW